MRKIDPDINDRYAFVKSYDYFRMFSGGNNDRFHSIRMIITSCYERY